MEITLIKTINCTTLIQGWTTAVTNVPRGTGTTAGTYRGTVLKKVPVTVPKAQK